MAISALTKVLRGSSGAPAVTLVARAVAPAPFDATPDGPTCAVELAAYQPTSGSLPGDQFDQYCEIMAPGAPLRRAGTRGDPAARA